MFERNDATRDRPVKKTNTKKGKWSFREKVRLMNGGSP